MIKFPLLVLIKGDINSRVVFAINNWNNKFAIPMFTDEKLYRNYLSQLNEGEMHAIALSDKYNTKAFIDATSFVAQVRWILINPLKYNTILDSGGQIYQVPEFLSKIEMFKINNKSVFKKRRRNKNK